MSAQTRKPTPPPPDDDVEAEPDWDAECCVCGQRPCVLVKKNGEVLFGTDMCGVCTWGEAECRDPENW